MNKATPAYSIPRTLRMLIGTAQTIMDARGITRADLAKLTKLSPPYVTQLLTGERPGSPGTWDIVLNALGFDFHDLGAYQPERRDKRTVTKETNWQADRGKPRGRPAKTQEPAGVTAGEGSLEAAAVAVAVPPRQTVVDIPAFEEL